MLSSQFLDLILAFFALVVAREDFSMSLAHESDFVSTLFGMIPSVTRNNDNLSIVSSAAGKTTVKKIKKTEQVQVCPSGRPSSRRTSSLSSLGCSWTTYRDQGSSPSSAW